MVAKSTSTLTPAQRKRTTLPARKTVANPTVMILASQAVVTKASASLAESLVSIGFHQEAGERAETTLWDRMATFRRYFPAAPGVRAILGEDAPDLYGQTPDYKAAWGKVLDTARQGLADRYVAEWGMNPIGAEKQAKDLVEKYRKANSVRYRNTLEAGVRANITNPVERARFMLAHGFSYQSNVSGDMCIPEKGAKLVDGAVTIPGFKVDAKAGTIKALKAAETPAGQDGKGGLDKGTETQQAIRDLTNVLAKKDQLGILESVNGLINGLVGLVAPLESTDLATRSRLIVETERSLKALYSHWGVTSASYRAARAYTAPTSEEDAKRQVAVQSVEKAVVSGS